MEPEECGPVTVASFGEDFRECDSQPPLRGELNVDGDIRSGFETVVRQFRRKYKGGIAPEPDGCTLQFVDSVQEHIAPSGILEFQVGRGCTFSVYNITDCFQTAGG